MMQSPSSTTANVGMLSPSTIGTPSSFAANHHDNSLKSPSSPATANSSSSSRYPDFDPVRVRQEWVDALFGRDFLRSPSSPSPPPLKGVGTANVSSYVAYTAAVPPRPNDAGADARVGVTISRIPLGACVRSLFSSEEENDGEARAAGVRVNDVLVSVNGMGVLGEPSHKLVERLWQYEGRPGAPTEGPINLTLLRDGVLRETVFWHPPPFGIDWAPCGNFALVQRSYSYAAEAGIKRGCIIAEVNGRSFRELDHASAAEELRDSFQKRQMISMTLAYTPAASRSNFYSPPADGTSSDNDQGNHTDHPSSNGVSNRGAGATNGGPSSSSSTPLTYLLQSSLTCGSTSTTAAGRDRSSSSHNHPPQRPFDEYAEAAAKVAAGEPPPTARAWAALAARSHRAPVEPRYSPCPELSRARALRCWDRRDAATECLRAAAANYDERASSTSTRLEEFAPDAVRAFASQAVATTAADEGAALVEAFSTRDDARYELHWTLESFWAATRSGGDDDGRAEDRRALTRLREALRERGAEIEAARAVALDAADTPEFDPPFDDGGSFDDGLGEPTTTPANASDGLDHADKDDDHVLTDTPKPSRKKKKGFMKRIFGKKKNSKSLASTMETSQVEDEDEDVDDYDELPRSPGSNKREQKSFTTTTTDGFDDLATIPAEEEFPSPFPSATKSITPNLITQPPSPPPPQRQPYIPMSTLLARTDVFLSRLDDVVADVRGLLTKTVSQKLAEWASHPWTATKERTLREATAGLRRNQPLSDPSNFPIPNPVDPRRRLVGLDPDECVVLPSAHFPVLLCFDETRDDDDDDDDDAERSYHVEVEVLSVRGAASPRAATIRGSVGGRVEETSYENEVAGARLTFETRSSWGAPDALTIDVGDRLGWVDLSRAWRDGRGAPTVHRVRLRSDPVEFDAQGDVLSGDDAADVEAELRVTATASTPSDDRSSKRLLLYKHTEDLRQETLATQFLDVCDASLRASGLDLRVRTFRCRAVGARGGFVEWVPGSSALSEICERSGFPGTTKRGNGGGASPTPQQQQPAAFLDGMEMEDDDGRVPASPGGESEEETSRFAALKGLTNHSFGLGSVLGRPSSAQNPVQDFLRSAAYDPDAPYWIDRTVMDTYVKSCAGYCVLTYLLGVGDRHLDNLLLHPRGHFFHCDFSFILGQDPKTYIPMRITEDMVLGMGGRDSDNFNKFLNLAGAAFVALRRRAALRVILATVRAVADADLPDVSVNQSAEDALFALRYRFRLDLDENDALTFIERLIESSVSSKLAFAVDAIHSFGKKF